ALRHDRPDVLDGPLFRSLLRRAGRRLDRRDRGRRPRAGRRSCAQLPSHRRPPPRTRLEDACGGQHGRHPADASDRGRGAKRCSGRAGASRALHVLRRSAEEPFPKGWDTLGEDLEQLVSPGELASLARVTQYAHFTPEFMGSAMWRALRRMGFSGGRVLEPGCGTGLFFALMPEALEDKTALTGVEMDPITARITKLLYPNAHIRAEDFTKARIPDSYDLVIGNPPFSSRTVRADDPAGQLSLSLHDYFIARSIGRLRPGGLAAFVTSRWTMDKADPTARTFLASMADLVGAVRLPEGAMRAA